jgi:hypothetical protein
VAHCRSQAASRRLQPLQIDIAMRDETERTGFSGPGTGLTRDARRRPATMGNASLPYIAPAAVAQPKPRGTVGETAWNTAQPVPTQNAGRTKAAPQPELVSPNVASVFDGDTLADHIGSILDDLAADVNGAWSKYDDPFA